MPGAGDGQQRASAEKGQSTDETGSQWQHRRSFRKRPERRRLPQPMCHGQTARFQLKLPVLRSAVDRGRALVDRRRPSADLHAAARADGARPFRSPRRSQPVGTRLSAFERREQAKNQPLHVVARRDDGSGRSGLRSPRRRRNVRWWSTIENSGTHWGRVGPGRGPSGSSAGTNAYRTPQVAVAAARTRETVEVV
jgi:hypothetical protein